MKKIIQAKAIVLFAVMTMLMNVAVWAQDSTISTTISTSEELWYMQPWVWIVGGIALLLILIALFSGSGKKNNASSRTDKVIITKTVRTETDVDES